MSPTEGAVQQAKVLVKSLRDTAEGARRNIDWHRGRLAEQERVETDSKRDLDYWTSWLDLYSPGWDAPKDPTF